MPRRVAPKCGRRHAGGRLSVTDELCLTDGHAFGVLAWEEVLRSPAAYRRLWSRWGEEITRRWITAFPGSRPMGCYLAGEIEPPAWRHELPPLRHPVKIAGEVVIADRAWHKGEVELDHLDDLGLIDDEEWRLATERLARSDARFASNYQCLADD
jgi:hypothetical protein